MKVSRLNTSLLVFLLTFFTINLTARAADDDEPDDYDVKARVVRISLITGEASLKRKGNQDWERARLNYPLVEGDTIATDKDSRMEIQMDARNFVRLAPDSVLQIVTLRDEGTALSVLEGTVILRLLSFDRTREYFEVDAPRTTMAAEKAGLYRIDVPRDGRVRLTVRDGGAARIYSDTSGFTLRDGRSAELVVSGEFAGDWNFMAAAPPDAIDDWINYRERYLAQRLRYDAEYYDDYVWGAEELAAYGEWNYTNDFGWIWRPHPSVIRVYDDWAPYRYGHWTWCPPYGWTWVGYEPWGWAPYHFGRWVYHNNSWAWVPRSKYHRKRSWWRPALVAFVNLHFSFGNDICWYPLSYYQRDPHSRYYRHQRPYPNPGHNPGGGGGGQNPPPRVQDYKTWRGVTRVPRTNFGDANERPRAADERVARRVIDSEPQAGDLPRPVVVGGNVPLGIELPDSPTGAAERTPGVPLDEDLRRSRIYRGREPRAGVPIQDTPVQTNAPPTEEPRNFPVGQEPRTGPPARQPRTGPPAQEPPSGPPAQETPPSGAVARPEPRPEPRGDERPGRMVRPTLPEGVEKRMRGQQGIEASPRREPGRGTEAPSEPRIEPRSEPAAEPRTEPRVEPPRSEPRPEPRSESPRPEPPPRRDPPPRVESPRSDPPPRNDPPPRVESPRSAPPPRNDPPPRVESPRSAPPPRNDPPPRVESPRSDPPPRNDPPPRSDPAPRNDPPPRAETPRESPKKPDDPNPNL